MLPRSATLHTETPRVRPTAVTTLAAFALILAPRASVLPQQAAPARPAPGAQPPAANGEVRGKAVDAKSAAPVARASVAVRVKADNVLIAGAIAGPDGSFRIQGLRNGVYTLRVTFIGFAPNVRGFRITNDTPGPPPRAAGPTTEERGGGGAGRD